MDEKGGILVSGQVRQLLPPGLRAVFAELDRHAARIPADVLARALSGLDDYDELRAFTVFDVCQYRRNELTSGPAYQALLICWRPGQRSPIHDHRGSSCAYRVLQGKAAESLFARTATGLVYPTRTRTHRPGCVASAGDDDIHQVSNLEEHVDLVTLHIYSPPLLLMQTYSLTERRPGWFAPPTLEFQAGAGI